MKNTFGPWGTSMNDDVEPQLSMFWKRRLDLLSTMSRNRTVLTRQTMWLLTVAGVAICALPTLWSASARADDQGLLQEYYGTVQAIEALVRPPDDLAASEADHDSDRDRKLAELERKLEELLKEIRAFRISEGQPLVADANSRILSGPARLEISTVGDRVEVQGDGFVARANSVRLNQTNGTFIFEGRASDPAVLWRGRGSSRDEVRGQKLFYRLKDGRVRVEGGAAISEEPRQGVDPRASSSIRQSDATEAWQQLGVALEPHPPEKLRRTGQHLRGGMRVVTVRPNSPAERSGIRVSDVLVGLDRWETITHDNVSFILNRFASGDVKSLKFYLLRDDEMVIGVMPLSGSQ